MTAVSHPSPRGRGCVVLILDGLGDLPVASLGGRTPLEAASTPNLDRFAAAGSYGLVDPVAEGVVPNTHTGVGLLFGLNPKQRGLLKRGPVEAAGAGLQLNAGDIAFRANFATLEKRDGDFFVVDRRAGRVSRDSAEFARVVAELDLGEDVIARFHPTDQHRGALVFSGPGLHPELNDTDPGDGPMPALLRTCVAGDTHSRFAASKVNRFIKKAHQRLVDHPLNEKRREQGKLPVTGVITRGAGGWFELDSMLDARGVRATLVAGCNTVAGLGRIFGMMTVNSASFTAGVDTDLRGKLEAACDALRHQSLVYVHIKAPDLFAHDLQPEGKKVFLEKLDRLLPILEESGAAIAVAADHSTDSNLGAHTADPGPTLFYAPSEKDRDEGRAAGEKIHFGERACRAGNRSRGTGHEFLMEIVSYLDS